MLTLADLDGRVKKGNEEKRAQPPASYSHHISESVSPAEDVVSTVIWSTEAPICTVHGSGPSSERVGVEWANRGEAGDSQIYEAIPSGHLCSVIFYVFLREGFVVWYIVYTHERAERRGEHDEHERSHILPQITGWGRVG
jgi:hypothetical protein